MNLLPATLVIDIYSCQGRTFLVKDQEIDASHQQGQDGSDTDVGFTQSALIMSDQRYCIELPHPGCTLCNDIGFMDFPF